MVCPDLHRDWARPAHICTRTGLTLPKSAPGPGRAGVSPPSAAVERRVRQHTRAARVSHSREQRVQPRLVAQRHLQPASSAERRLPQYPFHTGYCALRVVRSWRALGGACCTLHVACCTLHVARALRRNVRCIWQRSTLRAPDCALRARRSMQRCGQCGACGKPRLRTVCTRQEPSACATAGKRRAAAGSSVGAIIMDGERTSEPKSSGASSSATIACERAPARGYSEWSSWAVKGVVTGGTRVL